MYSAYIFIFHANQTKTRFQTEIQRNSEMAYFMSLLSLDSQKSTGYKENKYVSLSFKPRSRVRILMCRMRSITGNYVGLGSESRDVVFPHLCRVG